MAAARPPAFARRSVRRTSARRRAPRAPRPTGPTRPRRSAPSTHERGRRGEQLAVDLLREHGYRIVERNYRWSGGEIDIIAVDGDTLCFVEVRTRRDDEHGDPLETISPSKQRQITRAARLYLADHDVGDHYLRFDVVGIVYEPEPRATLLRGAFEAPSSW